MEVRTYQHTDGKWYFDIVDTSDVLVAGDRELPELVHSDGTGYVRESTAQRNGERWIEKQGAAS